MEVDGAGRLVKAPEARRPIAGDDGDLADLVTLIGNWEVARWVSSVPYPYSEADGHEWIATVRRDHATGRPRRFAIASKSAWLDTKG